MKIEIGNVLELDGVIGNIQKVKGVYSIERICIEMRALIQRVSRASVSVDNSIVVQIDKGLYVRFY